MSVKLVVCFSALAVMPLVFGQTEPTDNRTIDEIIAESANSSHQFDFMYDESSQQIIMELDMVFSVSQWREIVRANASTNSHGSRQKRKGVRFGSGGNKWTDNTVPYDIAPGVFNSGQRGQIMAALQDWMRYTCLTFRPATFSDRNKIRFQNGGGCFSNVGMTGGTQTVGLAWNCRVKSIIIHEVGHAIGFHHEQTRPDRDNYVTINYSNIPAGVRYNFQRYTRNVIDDRGVPYDYYSIMHYGGKAFSSTGGYTIVTKDQRYQNVIGRQNGHSFRDIKLANKMYNCAARCNKQDSECPGEGFVGKDCQCWCPGSPYKVCDSGNGRFTTTTTTTTTTTISPIVVTTTCRDNNHQCAAWASRGECRNNPAYMLEYCKQSCNRCGSGGRVTTACKDNNHQCAAWASRGECNNNPAYMLEYCKKSCNRCGSGGRVTCQDDNRHCRTWAGYGYCNTNMFRGYMRTNCKRSCNLCAASGSGTFAVTSPTSTASCNDRSGFCQSWAWSGECRRNQVYMLQMCRRSCGRC